MRERSDESTRRVRIPHWRSPFLRHHLSIENFDGPMNLGYLVKSRFCQ